MPQTDPPVPRTEPDGDRWYLAPWHALRMAEGPSSDLRKLRNSHPLSHSFVDKATRGKKAKSIRVPEPACVATLLDKADTELTEALADRYPSLVLMDRDFLTKELDRLLGEVRMFEERSEPVGQSGAAAE